MANLNVNVDGVSHVVAVPGYETMSPADQQHAIQMASQAVMAQSSQPAQPQGPDQSLSGNVMNGIKSAAQGFGETMKLAHLLPSWVPGQEAIPAAGQALENAVGTPNPNVDNGASSFVPDLTSGKLGAAAGDAARFAASSAPDMLGMLGASAVAGPAGAAAYAAGRNLGPTADARAANNGEATPTGTDVLEALPSTAAQAALAPVGLGKVGIVKGALEKLPAILKPVGKVALAGAEGAANTAVGEAGETAGTDKGLSVNPNDVLMGAIGGAGARAASLLPGAVRSAASGAAERGLLASTPVPDAPVPLVNWDDYVSDVRQKLGPKATEFQVQNAAKAQLHNDLRGLIADVPKGDPDATDNDIRLAKTALEAALRHNNDASALTAQVAALPWNSRLLAPLVSGLDALNAGASGSFIKAGIGPLQKAGGVIGRVAWPLVSLGHGNVPGAAAEFLFGGGIGSRVGSKVGAGLDQLMGTNRPETMLAALKARQYLQAMGGMPLTGINDGLSNARQTLDSMVADRLAKQRAGQQFDTDYKEAGIMNASFNQQPDVAAQAGLNKAARASEIKMRAGTMVPDDNPDVSAEAAAAATAKAMNTAEREYAWAGANNPQDALARKMVGLPPIDPQQVGPQPGDGPGPKTASKAPPAASVSGGSSTSAQEAPVAPSAAPSPGFTATGTPTQTGNTRDLSFEYFRNGTVAKRLPQPGVADYHRTIDAATAAGWLPPETAFQLKAGQPFYEQSVMRPLIEAYAYASGQRSGAGQRVTQGSAHIRNPISYKGTIDRHNSAVQDYVAKLRLAGQHSKADTALEVADAHGDTPEETKAAKLKAAKGQSFPAWLMEHGSK